MLRYFRLIKNVSNWWVHFFIKSGLSKKDLINFRLRNGVVLKVPKRLLHEFKEIIMEECYTAGLKFPVPHGSNVIDIGANVGFFSLFVASRFRDVQVFSFEPVPRNFLVLQENRDLNRHVRMECFPLAVYGHSGMVSLKLDAADKHPTNAQIVPDAAWGLNTVGVKAVTLEQVLDNYGIGRCNLLKMDCEGSEYEIVYNCSPRHLSKIDQMAIEVHAGREANHNIMALSAFLEENGFKTRRKRKAQGMLYAWQTMR
jgi:FkbM family methyltransferase